MSFSEATGIRIGAVFPQTEIGNDLEDIRTYATTVAELGYRHILAYDHVLSGRQQAHHPKLVNRYDENSPFHEVFVLFGYLAAIVPDLEMVTGVLILPQRQTALVAKQAATLDLLTAGKTRIGVGIGWNDIEYQGLGETFGNRGKRLEEQMDVLRRLWTDEIVSYDGTWHTIDHAGLAPMPAQRPIPIWIGGSAEIAVRRAARLADGFFPNSGTQETYERIMAILQDELGRTGRDPATFGIEPRISVAVTKPDDWKRSYSWWREQGVSHITVNTMGGHFTSVDQHLDALGHAMTILGKL
ncbi:MAG: LLM class F420-dependent oxidoreductase [Chloroflexota bacterium]|nr:LLM class F420-dependent oxidoreductase [Chloroflexota bacterium]